MANSSGYIIRKSNYTLYKMHKLLSSGTIYVRDYMVTNGNTWDDSKILPYGESNFRIIAPNDGPTSLEHRKADWVSWCHGETEDPDVQCNLWTYNSLTDEKSSESEIKIKPDFSTLRDFVYYGSAVEAIKNSIDNIIKTFPGELYVTDKSYETMYGGGQGGGQLGSDGFNNPVIVANPFNINISSLRCPSHLPHINRMRYFCNYFTETSAYTYEQYVIISKGGDESSTSVPSENVDKVSWSVERFSPKCSDGVHYKDGQCVAEVTLNNKIKIREYFKDGRYVLMTDSKYTGIHVRPNEEYINKYFEELTGVEQLILNIDSDPRYTMLIEYPKETDYGMVTSYERFTWNTGDGDWNLIVDTGNAVFSKYVNELLSLATLYDEYYTNNLWKNMVHPSIKNMDLTYVNEKTQEDSTDFKLGLTKMEELMYSYGIFFDLLKKYIDNIKTVNRISYNGYNNVPDYFLSDLLDRSGWEVYSAVNGLDPETKTDDDLFFGVKHQYTVNETNTIFLKNLLLNSRSILLRKGTRAGLEMLFGLFGLASYDFVENLKYFGYYSWEKDGYDQDNDQNNQDDNAQINQRKKRGFADNEVPDWDYRIDEFVCIAHPREGCLRHTGDDGEPDWTYKVDEDADVEIFNTFKKSYDEEGGPLEGLPLATVYYSKTDDDGETKTRKYFVPWFNNGEKYDGDLYYQMNGGWGSMDKTLLGTNTPSSKLTELSATKGFKIYDETVKNLIVLSNVRGLAMIPYKYLEDGMIVKVNTDANDIYPTIDLDAIYGEDSTEKYHLGIKGEIEQAFNIRFDDGLKTEELSKYFVLRNKKYSDHYANFGIDTSEVDDQAEKDKMLGWENVLLKHIEDGDTIEGKKVLYVENIIESSLANNPHSGYWHYDGGRGYIEHFDQIFKYSIENDNFNNNAYYCNPNAEEQACKPCNGLLDEIKCYGFDNLIVNDEVNYIKDNLRCWFFTNDNKVIDKETEGAPIISRYNDVICKDSNGCHYLKRSVRQDVLGDATDFTNYVGIKAKDGDNSIDEYYYRLYNAKVYENGQCPKDEAVSELEYSGETPTFLECDMTPFDFEQVQDTESVGNTESSANSIINTKGLRITFKVYGNDAEEIEQRIHLYESILKYAKQIIPSNVLLETVFEGFEPESDLVKPDNEWRDNSEEPVVPTPDEKEEEDNRIYLEYVDLGLDSGTLWANINVNDNGKYNGKHFVKTLNDKGNYHKWGDINSDASAFVNDGEDGGTVPSSPHFTELIEQCEWIKSSYGYTVKSYSNGKSIFLPFNGYSSNDSVKDLSNGHYWSSTEVDDDATKAKCLFFTMGYQTTSTDDKINGLGLRLIKAGSGHLPDEKTLKIVVDNKTKVYGTGTPELTYHVEGGELVGMVTLTCDCGEQPVAGTSAITASYNGPETITIENGTFTVSKAPLTISAKNATITQGDAIPSTFDVICQGFVYGQTLVSLGVTVTASCDATSESEVGDYPITIVISNTDKGKLEKNYDVTYVNGTLKITAKPQANVITVTAMNKTITYGDPIPVVLNPVLGVDYTIEGYSRPERIIGSPIITVPLHEGEIVISEGNMVLPQGYKWKFVNGLLTIEELPSSQGVANMCTHIVKNGDNTFTLKTEDHNIGDDGLIKIAILIIMTDSGVVGSVYKNDNYPYKKGRTHDLSVYTEDEMKRIAGGNTWLDYEVSIVTYTARTEDNSVYQPVSITHQWLRDRVSAGSVPRCFSENIENIYVGEVDSANDLIKTATIDHSRNGKCTFDRNKFKYVWSATTQETPENEYIVPKLKITYDKDNMTSVFVEPKYDNRTIANYLTKLEVLDTTLGTVIYSYNFGGQRLSKALAANGLNYYDFDTNSQKVGKTVTILGQTITAERLGRETLDGLTVRFTIYNGENARYAEKAIASPKKHIGSSDYFIFQYLWNSNAGRDLDSFTVIRTDAISGACTNSRVDDSSIYKVFPLSKLGVGFGESVKGDIGDGQMTGSVKVYRDNNIDVTWPDGSVQKDADGNAEYYMRHGGDNIDSGAETAIIYFNNIRKYSGLPSNSKVYIDIYANWYREKGNGKMSINAAAYKSNSSDEIPANRQIEITKNTNVSTGKCYRFIPSNDATTGTTCVWGKNSENIGDAMFERTVKAATKGNVMSLHPTSIDAIAHSYTKVLTLIHDLKTSETEIEFKPEEDSGNTRVFRIREYLGMRDGKYITREIGTELGILIRNIPAQQNEKVFKNLCITHEDVTSEEEIIQGGEVACVNKPWSIYGVDGSGHLTFRFPDGTSAKTTSNSETITNDPDTIKLEQGDVTEGDVNTTTITFTFGENRTSSSRTIKMRPVVNLELSDGFKLTMPELDDHNTIVQRELMEMKLTQQLASSSLAPPDPSGDFSPNDYVNLGLPSGNLWRNRNIGANVQYYSGWLYPYDEINSAITEVGDDWVVPTEADIRELMECCDWWWSSWNGVDGYFVRSRVNDNEIFLPACGYEYDTKQITDNMGYYWSSDANVPPPEYTGDDWSAKALVFGDNEIGEEEYDERLTHSIEEMNHNCRLPIRPLMR